MMGSITYLTFINTARTSVTTIQIITIITFLTFSFILAFDTILHTFITLLISI